MTEKEQGRLGLAADRALVNQAPAGLGRSAASIPDAKLIEIATGVREGVLGGLPSFMMCAAVSWPLAAYLRSAHGVDCETVEIDIGECNHVWVKLADGRALDPTIDQFNRWFPWKNFPPVYVGPVAEYERLLGL